MKKTLITIGILIIILQLKTQADPAPLRIALMSFVCDDNSYRSTVAMEDLSSLLQAELSSATNYDWVERAELEKSADEFKIAGFGLIDRSEAIRIGRWAKADWGIFGDVSTNLNGKRTLTMEVVDLQRADVLAETNLSLPSNEIGFFLMKPEYVPTIASALRTLLDQAHIVYQASQKQDSVALLFVTFNQTGSLDPWGDIATDFRHSLLTESEKNRRFHLVQFQRAGVAMDEASLVLSGLAETDSNSWEKVADHYVWGDAHLEDQKTFDWNSREWLDQRILVVKLNVWDGRGEPQVIALTVTNEASADVARELTGLIEPLLQQTGPKPILENIRNQISDSIFSRYTGLPMNFWFDSPEGRKQWFDDVQLLETACFFNPGNAAAREQLLRLRWGTSLAGTDAGKEAARMEHVGPDRLMLAGELESASRNKFFLARRRSDAWGKYVEQFGLTTALAKPESPSIASEYVLSAWQPLDMFNYAQENQLEWGVPSDAGLHEINEWKNQLGSNFVSRLLEVSNSPALLPSSTEFFYDCLAIPSLETRTRIIAQYWPQILKQAKQSPIALTDDREYLRQYFLDVGQPDGDEKLLAQLDAAKKAGNSVQTAAIPSPQTVQLPRFADLAAPISGDFFDLPPMLFPPTQVIPKVQNISFPPGFEIKNVKTMAFHGDTLWLAITLDEPLQIEAVNSQYEKQFQPVTVERSRLWKLKVESTRPEPVTGSLATNDVNDLLFDGDTLWLALNDAGIASLNVKTGDLRRYGGSAGLTATNQYRLTDTPQGIVAAGGMSDLSFLDHTSEKWTGFTPAPPQQTFSFGGDLRKLASLNEELLFYNSQVLLCDLSSNTWIRITDRQTLDQIGRVNSLTSDKRRNFWLASDSGLHQVDADTGKLRSQWISISPKVKVSENYGIPGQTKPYKKESDLVQQIQQTLKSRRHMLDNKQKSANLPNLFMPNSRIDAGVDLVSPDDDFVWVLTKSFTHVSLYHPASRSWVGEYFIPNLGMPSAMTCGDGKLWLATQLGDGYSILVVDTGALKFNSRSNWLSDELTKQELDMRLVNLSDHERAIYYFFSGDDASAVKALQAQAHDPLDAESLFLLHSCYAELGELDQAGKYEQHLTNAFPDSVFTEVSLLNNATSN